MNLLLVHPDEVDDAARVKLDGRRARHLLDVLGVDVGRALRCGVVDGALGEAVVLGVGHEAVELQLTLGKALVPPPHVLILAVPRPKVLRRVVRDAASLGFGHVVLLRSWRVDKAHMQSHVLDAGELRASMIDGLEQGRRTHVPTLTTEPLFKPFVEDRLQGWLTGRRGCVAHLGEGDAASPGEAAVCLAVGPERGWTDFEVELLCGQGMRPVHLGPHPLRVETAVAALAGALGVPD